MAKYKLKNSVISVHIAGKTYTKKDDVTFDTGGNFKKFSEQVEAAAKKGFFERVDTAKGGKSAGGGKAK